ncbi:MAG: hypothetical protein CM1200mP39_26970 [Dehalococcoidia bacterium]|nr:MAG: hypothetical protein CM1200mP39_26970 [Dehalococcoidia bacterium]
MDVCSEGYGVSLCQPENQSNFHPLTISHGMNRPIGDSSRFRLDFDWTGTRDMTGFCTLPRLIKYMRGISDSGWAGIGARNHALVVEVRDLICQALDLESPCPVDMIGSLATICLPGLENIIGKGSKL